MTLAVGIDVGGTKVAAGLVDVDTGEVLRLVKESTPAAEGGPSVLDLCGRLVAELGDDGIPVGVGLCELVDREGHCCSGVTVDWRGLDVEAVLGAATLESDVRAAALAEARFGAGRDWDNFMYVSIGTGISHTLVQAGEPYAGAHGFAIMVGAPPIEHTSSGRALSEAARTDTRTALADPVHREMVEAASQSLGHALAFLINALDPGAVIVGGGLGLNPDYLARIGDALRANVASELSDVPLVTAELGEAAGLIGAGLAASRK